MNEPVWRLMAKANLIWVVTCCARLRYKTVQENAALEHRYHSRRYGSRAVGSPGHSTVFRKPYRCSALMLMSGRRSGSPALCPVGAASRNHAKEMTSSKGCKRAWMSWRRPAPLAALQSDRFQPGSIWRFSRIGPMIELLGAFASPASARRAGSTTGRAGISTTARYQNDRHRQRPDRLPGHRDLPPAGVARRKVFEN